MRKRTIEERLYDEVMSHINGKRSLREEYDLIMQKKSELSARCREWVIKNVK